MYPYPKAGTSFKYPRSGLLQLRGVVKEKELRHPPMLDANGDDCLLASSVPVLDHTVVKNGNTTGVTIGRLTGIQVVQQRCLNQKKVGGPSKTMNTRKPRLV